VAERAADTERQYKETGSDLASCQAGDRQEQSQEPPFLTELEKHEAARDAKIQELDAKVQSGKINQHEMQYQLNRFENTVSPAQNKTGQEQPGGQQQERKLVFSEDRERAASGERSGSQASRDKGQSQSKERGEDRTLTFFEDRNKSQDREH
jgi:hypothetical protein